MNTTKTSGPPPFNNNKTVYGPVDSWRFGQSLGIDPIFDISTCSFNCIYCQLGDIQKVTTEVRVYVETAKVLADFQEVMKTGKPVDVITYSGSGEPTLAVNLGDMIAGIKKLAPSIPQIILTNGTQLWDQKVQQNLQGLDRVIIKLDAGDEKTFQAMNRPAAGVSLESIVAGARAFKKSYKGAIEAQCMFMPLNTKELRQMAELLKEISPEVVQLNTPKRPYPLSWHRENRGNHLGLFDYEVRRLKTIDNAEAVRIETELRQLTGLNILSVYRV